MAGSGISPARRARRRMAGTAPRLYEGAIESVIDRLAAGAMLPGDEITETRLAAELGISRAPARHALAELERRGLFDRVVGRGYVVRGGAGLAQLRAPAGGGEARLQPRSSWQRIYAEVENEIVSRIVFGEWRLNEARLALHFHVSRTVARDVVGRLQQRGLVRKDDSARWVAQALTPERVSDLYELRAILEPAALEKAAPRVPAAALDAMERSLAAALADGVGEGDVLDRLEEDLHVALLGYCGNAALIQAVMLPQSLLTAHRFLYRWTSELFGSEPFLPEHVEILRHVRAGDARAAAEAMRRHLEVSRDRAIARVDVVRHEFAAEDLPYLERVRPA